MALSWRELARTLTAVVVREAPRVLQQIQRSTPRPTGRASARSSAPESHRVRASAASASASGAPIGRHLAYAPKLDGDADPGEVVWTWVAYEEDPSQGKDRPVLVVGREGGALLGLMLSSQHERDGQHGWLALGVGTWDREARSSWVRLDRVLQVSVDGIRREGAVLDRARFERVADALRAGYGWQ